MELGWPLDAQQPVKARRPGFHPHVSIVVLACLLLVVGFGIDRTLWPSGHSPSARPAGLARQAGSWPQSPWLNARPGVKYVGDAACAHCHPDIAETFRLHPMGRSLAPIASAPAVGSARPTGTTTFSAGPSVFTIDRRDGREIHRETCLDGGKVLAQVEAEVAYAVGSGARSITYLVEHDGRLFESPITWYTQKQKWDLSPGYEKISAHFDRPIDPDCLFCHSNRVEPIALSANRYKEPVFQGHAIGCERCHGPGELHARHPELSGGRDLTIVNPRHLDPVLRGNICEQCHLVGDRRVNRLGRDAFDYRPGLPLTEFVVDYGYTTDEGQKLVGQVEQMKDSRCFRASQGRLGCMSCHDPHEVPDPEEKIAYFRERCLACHEDHGCKLPEPVRLARDRQDYCIGCHMPLSQTVDAVHIAVRDHRILREPNAEATAARRSSSPFPLVRLNGDVDSEHLNSLDRELAIALVAQWTRLPPTPQLRKIGLLLVSALDKVVADNPDDLEARRMKAQALSFTGRYSRALPIAESLLKLTPSYELLLDDYTSYAIDLKRFQAALEPAKRAVALNPWSAACRERLAFLSMQCQDWDGARHEAREALRLNPFLRFARMFLVQCLLHDKDTKAADNEFATLVKLHADQRESLEEWLAEQRRR
jgi:predicted CXXCH cytochrome family protein